MKKAIVCFSAFAAAAALSAQAFAADVCLQFDGSRDDLSREERAQAQSMLARVVESMGNTISSKACSQTYLVSHQKTREGIEIHIVGPGGERDGRCAGVGELEGVYQRLLTPKSRQRAEVPKELAAPKREAADKMFYARVGGSAVPSSGFQGGPDLGLGLRLELDRVGIDASISLGVTQTGPKMSVTGYRASWLEITTHYFLAPESDNSPYLGVGLSWGGRTEQISDQKYGGTGLQGELTAGWEFLRNSTIRIFVQADATLPFYMASCRDSSRLFYLISSNGGDTPDQRYLPTIGLSLGIGWGRPHVRGVVKMN